MIQKFLQKKRKIMARSLSKVEQRLFCSRESSLLRLDILCSIFLVMELLEGIL